MPEPKPHRLKSGTVVWRVQYRVDGRPVTDTFETVTLTLIVDSAN